MARLLHSVAVQNQDPAADGVFTHDLPVNPLSVIMIALRPLNDTGTLANFAEYLDLVQAINRVDVRFQGASVVSLTGYDAAMLALFRHGIHPMDANPDDTDNERRCVVLPLVLGRFPYSAESCFPATRRGELTIDLDVDIADTGYDDLQYTIETIELLGATPSEYERTVQNALTPAATGLTDIDLPLGNVIRGILLFGTTDFTGATPVPSWGRLQLMLDNQEYSYSSTDWEVSQSIAGLTVLRHPNYDRHTHRVDATAASATQETFSNIEYGNGLLQYSYLDLDPWGNDEFSIDTKGHSRCHIRANIETADAIRAIPIERVAV